MPIRTVKASDYCTLDSNVYTGGGTDVTATIQGLLDIARDEGGVHLIMDGVALVSHLRVYSNTVIECLTLDCGFYQKAHSDNSILVNAIGSQQEIKAHDITIIGGTYNQNCAEQAHHRALKEDDPPFEEIDHGKYMFAIEFYGVANLTVKNCIIRDFRTYAFMLGCFRNCTIENVWLDLPGRMQAQNQDGFHFWGPGQYLTVRNVGGRVGDDFMNIGPDEGDQCSPITDVLVDGVFLDDADQAIRILSRGTGLVDRITIRNVIGTYRSFGFYINAWFPGPTCGRFGDLFFENIDLTQTAPNYEFRPPMLFSVGGEIRSLICKNIRHMEPFDNRSLFELGLPFYATVPDTIDSFQYEGIYPHIDHFEIDGLTILESSENAANAAYLRVYGLIDNMILRHVTAIKHTDERPNSELVYCHNRAEIKQLVLDSIYTKGMKTLVENPEKIQLTLRQNVVERN